MFCFNIIKNINKKSILYSISTLSISTNFGMDSNQGVFIEKIQEENINLFTVERKKTTSLGRKRKNSLENCYHNKFSRDNIRRGIFIKFSDYLFELLNYKLEEIKKKCDIFEDFEDFEDLKKNIRFKKMKSLSQILLTDIYDILNSKLGYYCVTTCEKICKKTDYNEKLIDKCILCENACSKLCDIFCSDGSAIYNDFLSSDFYQNILDDIEQKNGEEYKEKYDNIAKDIINAISNEKFIKKLDINRKGFLDKNVDKKFINFFEDRINYYDEIFNKEIELNENKELDFSNIPE